MRYTKCYTPWSMPKSKIQDQEKVAISIRYKDSFLIANKAITETISSKISNSEKSILPATSKYNFKHNKSNHQENSQVCNIM